MDNIHVVKDTISLRSRTKLKKSLKTSLTVVKCKHFKNKARVSNNFHFITPGVVYKFQCGLCNEFMVNVLYT